MSLPFRPAIRREYADELLFSLPMLPWDFLSGGVGGSAVSAAGVPESYVIREDRIVEVTLRVSEEELDAVLAEMESIRATSEAFTFAFDQDEDATDHEVYLHAPVWPEEIRPDRDDEYPGAFRLTIALRTTDGSPFTTLWVDAEGLYY